MGIVKKLEENNCKIAVWDLQESLIELNDLYSESKIPIFTNEKRKKEFLATRILLKEINPNQSISYNTYGAPELDNNQYISISHSDNLVALIISKKKVGLDIEKISSKALRLSSKFISEIKFNNISKEKATLIWCAKEAIYKWYQKKNINFKNDIKIYPFKLENKGTVIAKFKNQKQTLYYNKIDTHFLVYVCK